MRHRTAETELEAQCDEVLGLHLAAIEGMGDAAAHRDTAQALQQGIGRAPHMQDHRQTNLLGQSQLGQIEALLLGAVQSRHEVVQPDLADGHQPWVATLRAQRLAQPLQVGLGGMLDIQRVDAQRIDRVVGLRQLAHHIEVGHLHRRQHQPRHARSTGALNHRRTVRIELGRVEVAVGVGPEQHGRIMPRPIQPDVQRTWPDGPIHGPGRLADVGTRGCRCERNVIT